MLFIDGSDLVRNGNYDQFSFNQLSLTHCKVMMFLNCLVSHIK